MIKLEWIFLCFADKKLKRTSKKRDMKPGLWKYGPDMYKHNQRVDQQMFLW